MSVILRHKLIKHKNVKIAMCQFVPNFVSYVFAKYYLNWFIVAKIIAKNK